MGRAHPQEEGRAHSDGTTGRPASPWPGVGCLQRPACRSSCHCWVAASTLLRTESKEQLGGR